MRRLILFLAAAVPLVAATTTVTQPIVGPDGQPASGVAYIRITAPCSYSGSYVGERTITVKFAPSGSPPATTFSVALVPNVGTNGSIGGSGACAGTSYTVSWAFAGGQNQPPETWLVPVSATPVSIDAVKTGPVPLPAVQINPSQISAAGGTIGQAMCLTISGWAAGACGGGGGGATWGSIGGTLSSQTDLATALSGKQPALSNYSAISGLTGYPSTFPPATSGDWGGTWQTHAPGYFQPALSNYSAISGLTGYPSTFPTGVVSNANGGLGTAKITVTAPTTAWTIQPAGDNQTTTIPGGTLTRTIASGTAALGTSALASGKCYGDSSQPAVVTATATGTLTTDVLTAGFNGDPHAVTGYIPSTSGMLTILVYPTADTANFMVCNNTSASITAGAVTLNWRVVR
jgi:hypothetical protein